MGPLLQRGRQHLLSLEARRLLVALTAPAHPAHPAHPVIRVDPDLPAPRRGAQELEWESRLRWA